MVVYTAKAYGANLNAGANVNGDNSWGGYQWTPNGDRRLPASLLGWAEYGDVRVQIRKELVQLAELTLAIADKRHGYTVYTRNPNGNGENWGPWGYEHRPIAGTQSPSNHSRGRAMDWNAPWNPYASGFAAIKSDFPPAMVADIESLGWGWGGRYGDAMHWEYAYSPSEVGAHVLRARALLAGPQGARADAVSRDWFDGLTRPQLEDAIVTTVSRW